MTVSTTSISNTYLGNGISTVFPFMFKIDSADQLKLFLVNATTGEFIRDYVSGEFTFTGVGENSGSVTLSTPPTTSQRLYILRQTPRLQQTDIVNQGGFFPEVVEQALDNLEMQIQEIDSEIERAITVPWNETGFMLQPISERRLRPAIFDSTGKLIAAPSGTNLPSVPTVNTLNAWDYGIVPGMPNAQPALQSLIELAEALGIHTIQMDDGTYTIWCPLRTHPTDELRESLSGIPLVIRKPITFVSGPNGTHFQRLTWTGGDPAVFANTQILPDNAVHNGQTMPWRGGMFFLAGLPTSGPPPANYSDRPALTLRGKWNIDGSIPMSKFAKSGAPALIDSYSPGQSGALPAWYELKRNTTADWNIGDGWDITDKCITAGFDSHTGDVVLYGDIWLHGFRGELTYQGGTGSGSWYQYGRLVLSDSDANGLNLCPCVAENGPGTIYFENVYVTDVFQPFEGWTGEGGYLRMYAQNCPGTTYLQGGTVNSLDTTTNYRKATRLHENVLPLGEIDFTHVNCGPVKPGNWMRGNIVAVDTDVFIEGTVYLYPRGIQDTHLRIELWADQKENGSTFGISGDQTPGTMGFRNCTFEVHCRQTEHAKAVGNVCLSPFSYNGSIGPNVWVENGTGPCKWLPYVGGNIIGTPDYLVNFRNNKYQRIRRPDGTVDAAYNYYAPDETFTPAYPETSTHTTFRYTSDYTALSSVNPLTVCLPESFPFLEGNGTPRLNDGAEWTLFNGGDKPITIPPRNGSGGQYSYQAIIIPPLTEAKFRYNDGWWVPCGPAMPYISAQVSYTPQISGGVIPAGRRSDIYTIPVPGVAHDHFVSVTSGIAFPDYVSLGFNVVPDAVKFWVRNEHPTADYVGITGFAQAIVTGGWSFLFPRQGPAAPSVVATAVSGGISLAITDGATGGKPIIGYRVFRKNAEGAFVFLSYALGTAPWVDHSPLPGVNTYKVAAINGYQIVSAMSAEASASTDGGSVPPTITSPSSATGPENTPISLNLTANQSVTWSLSGGDDRLKFTLSGNTLTLPAKDFEMPDDADFNNVYLVRVGATNSASQTTTKDISFVVTNVDDTVVAALPGFSAKMAAVASNTADAIVVEMGDSTLMGHGADGGPNDVGARPLASTYRMAARLRNLGYKVSTDAFSCDGGTVNTPAGYTAYNSLVTYGPGWITTTTQSLGGRMWSKSSTTPGPMTFSPELPSQWCDMIMRTSPSAGSVQPLLDGAPWGPPISTTGSAGLIKFTIDAGSSGMHTYGLESTSVSVIYPILGMARDVTKRAIILNAGYRGQTSANAALDTSGYSSTAVLRLLAPDLTTIAYGINDFRDGSITTGSQYQTSIQYLITQAKLSGEVALIGPYDIAPGNETGTLTMEQVTTLLKSIGASASPPIPVFDMIADIGSYPAPTGQYDGLHGSAATYNKAGTDKGTWFAGFIGAVPATPTVSIAAGSVIEGNSGTSNLPFVITLSPAALANVTMTINTANGTATAPSDYIAIVNGTVTINAGQTSTTVNVVVNGDTDMESNETFNLIASNLSGNAVFNGGGATLSATGTIINDDAPPATVPVAPTLGTPIASNGQLSIPFTEGANGGAAIDGRYYSLKVGSGSYGALQPATITGGNLVITGLTNGTAYSVLGYTHNSVGYSLASNEVTGTPAAPSGAALPGFKSAMTAVASNSANALFVMQGDNQLMGHGADGGPDDAGCRVLTSSYAMAARLRALGRKVSTDAFSCNSNITTLARFTAFDTRMSFGPGWSISTTASLGGFMFLKNSATAGPMNFTPELPSRWCNFIVRTSPTGGSIQPFVDGVAVGSPISTAAPAGLMMFTVDAGTSGMHTFGLDSTSAANIYPIAGMAHDTEKRLIILNAGVRGQNAAAAATDSQPYSAQAVLRLLAPNLTSIAEGMNDFRDGSTLSSSAFQTSINYLVTQAKAGGGEVIYIGPYDIAPARNNGTLTMAGVNALYQSMGASASPQIPAWDTIANIGAYPSPYGQYDQIDVLAATQNKSGTDQANWLNGLIA